MLTHRCALLLAPGSVLNHFGRVPLSEERRRGQPLGREELLRRGRGDDTRDSPSSRATQAALHASLREGDGSGPQTQRAPRLTAATAFSSQRRRALPWAEPSPPSSLPPPAEAETAEHLNAAGRMLESLEDDDVVLDTPMTLFQPAPSELAAPSSSSSSSSAAAHALKVVPGRRAGTPAAAASSPAVGQDVIDLVTDAYTAQREAEVARRREVLYRLTHPDPADYTYRGKLVPPPPLSFGQITREAQELGRQLMLEQSYQLVHAAGVRVDGAEGAGGDNDDGISSTAVEVDVRGGGASRPRSAAAVSSHRGRRREQNPFRDHNLFFEINELYQEVVVVGRANAGKSSLLNALLGQPVARSSSSPHSTRKINFYQSVSPEELRAFHERERHNLVRLPGRGLQLTFVDMPGYGIEGMSDKWRDSAIELTDAYFGVRRSVNTVLFCIDCDRGLTKTDLKYFQWLENVQGVFYVVLTKCDAVPHSRVCSVMRQIYVLITENRRKYRKVFPFVLPTSARDGSNVDVLRGLITETSGLIPGDKLREMLQRKQEADMNRALEAEAARIAEARRLEREQARQLFLGNGGGAPAAAGDTDEADEAPGSGQAQARAPAYVAPSARPRRLSHHSEQDLDQVLSEAVDDGDARRASANSRRPHSGSAAAPVPSAGTPFPSGNSSGAAHSQAELRRRSREEFVAWRRQNPLPRVQTPYGGGGGRRDATGGHFRANTGLENPLGGGEIALGGGAPEDDSTGELAMTPLPENHLVEGEETAPVAAGAAALPHARASEPSRVVGLDGGGDSAAPTGPQTARVSAFLESVERFGAREEKPQQQRRRRGRGGPSADGPSSGRPNLLVECADGRLASYSGGRRGALLPSADTPEATRRAAWQAAQLRRALQAANPTAPWAAVQAVRQRAERAREEAALRRMSPKEVAAYVRDAGGVTESFDKFENELAATKFATEVRVAPTLRSQQQMHLNATAKINYRSMPPGLWKKYGQRKTHWPTPSVVGRENDETHRPGIFHPE